MTSPLERAARALVSWELGLSDPATDKQRFGHTLADRQAEVDRRWPEKVEQVRAVIGAIREPSESMEQAGYGNTKGDPDNTGIVDNPRPDDAWCRMIDALLAE